MEWAILALIGTAFGLTKRGERFYARLAGTTATGAGYAYGTARPRSAARRIAAPSTPAAKPAPAKKTSAGATARTGSAGRPAAPEVPSIREAWRAGVQRALTVRAEGRDLVTRTRRAATWTAERAGRTWTAGQRIVGVIPAVASARATKKTRTAEQRDRLNAAKANLTDPPSADELGMADWLPGRDKPSARRLIALRNSGYKGAVDGDGYAVATDDALEALTRTNPDPPAPDGTVPTSPPAPEPAEEGDVPPQPWAIEHWRDGRWEPFTGPIWNPKDADHILEVERRYISGGHGRQRRFRIVRGTEVVHEDPDSPTPEAPGSTTTKESTMTIQTTDFATLDQGIAETEQALAAAVAFQEAKSNLQAACGTMPERYAGAPWGSTKLDAAMTAVQDGIGSNDAEGLIAGLTSARDECRSLKAAAEPLQAAGARGDVAAYA